MIIKLVRHGESMQQTGEMNATVVGDHRVPLSAEGFKQAREVGKNIGAEFIQHSLLYCSPYLRTKQTMLSIIDGANVIKHGEVPRIYYDPRLREVGFGYNKTAEQIRREKRLRETHGYFYYQYERGDSAATCYDRMCTFLESLTRQLARKRARNVLIVAHGISIRTFVMRFMHLTVEDYDDLDNPENCDLITIGPAWTMTDPQFVRGKWGVNGLRFYETLTK